MPIMNSVTHAQEVLRECCLATVFWQLTTIKRRVFFCFGRRPLCAVPRLLNTLSVLMGQPWVGYGLLRVPLGDSFCSEEGCAICMSLGFCRDLSKMVTLSYCNSGVTDWGVLKAFNRNHIQKGIKQLHVKSFLERKKSHNRVLMGKKMNMQKFKFIS